MKKPVRQAAKPSDPKAAEAVAHGVVRRINRTFSANLPTAAVRSGNYDVPRKDLEAQVKETVPNGLYRVLGHDWVHRFSGGKWISSFKARSDTDAKSIVDVA